MTDIYIPTYRRVGAQTTWASISPSWRERTVLVAEEAEAESLDLLGYPVLVCPEDGSISAKRQWILDQHPSGVAIMLDDDLRFAIRRDDEPTKFARMTEHDEFDRMMDSFALMMSKVPFGGIRNRGGAHMNVGPHMIRDTRVNGAMGINVDVARAEDIRFDRVPLMEDFSVALQFLTRGHHTALINDFVLDDANGSNASGGCSVTRDTAGQAEAARQLQAMFPRFVAMVDRPGWKGSDESRKDVRVQWKKAYEYGSTIGSLL